MLSWEFLCSVAYHEVASVCRISNKFVHCPIFAMNRGDISEKGSSMGDFKPSITCLSPFRTFRGRIWKLADILHQVGGMSSAKSNIGFLCSKANAIMFGNIMMFL